MMVPLLVSMVAVLATRLCSWEEVRRYCKVTSRHPERSEGAMPTWSFTRSGCARALQRVAVQSSSVVRRQAAARPDAGIAARRPAGRQHPASAGGRRPAAASAGVSRWTTRRGAKPRQRRAVHRLGGRVIARLPTTTRWVPGLRCQSSARRKAEPRRARAPARRRRTPRTSASARCCQRASPVSSCSRAQRRSRRPRWATAWRVLHRLRPGGQQPFLAAPAPRGIEEPARVARPSSRAQTRSMSRSAQSSQSRSPVVS